MKLKIIAITLGLALIGSNGWWLYQYAILKTNIDDLSGTQYEAFRSLSQALAIANTMASNPEASQAQVLQATRVASQDFHAFKIKDMVWVGSIGLSFDSAGRLTKAVTNWPIVREEFNSADTRQSPAGWMNCTEVGTT